MNKCSRLFYSGPTWASQIVPELRLVLQIRELSPAQQCPHKLYQIPSTPILPLWAFALLHLYPNTFPLPPGAVRIGSLNSNSHWYLHCRWQCHLLRKIRWEMGGSMVKGDSRAASGVGVSSLLILRIHASTRKSCNLHVAYILSKV